MNEKNLTINGFSNNYLLMRVNSGTKMKNVLHHALDHFPQQYDNIVWTGAGQAIGKVISCVELFKRKNPGLHQVTKLRYIDSNDDVGSTRKKQQIPEINIFLSKETMHASELGYQSASDMGVFQNTSVHRDTSRGMKSGEDTTNEGAISNTVAHEFTAFGLRTSQKRSRRSQTNNFPIPKKNKSTKNTEPPGPC